MDIYQLKKLTAEERAVILEGESSTSEEQTYSIPMNDEELTVAKDDLAQASLQKAYLDEEIRQAKEAFKARMEPLSEKISEAIGQLKTRAREVHGRVWSIPDFENKMMHSVDGLGNVLNSRPLKPEERQYRLGQKSA